LWICWLWHIEPKKKKEFYHRVDAINKLILNQEDEFLVLSETTNRMVLKLSIKVALLKENEISSLNDVQDMWIQPVIDKINQQKKHFDDAIQSIEFFDKKESKRALDDVIILLDYLEDYHEAILNEKTPLLDACTNYFERSTSLNPKPDQVNK